MRTEPPLLAPIFRSDGQARLLAVALLDGEFSLSDLAERAGLAYATAHREVTRLLAAGILAERTVGRTRLIRANESSPLVPPLTEILTISAGPVALLRQALLPIANIETAVLYGSFAARSLRRAGDAPRDIDVLVVGKPSADDVYDACLSVEREVQRPVNPTIFTRSELSGDSGFLRELRASPMITLIGTLPWP